MKIDSKKSATVIIGDEFYPNKSTARLCSKELVDNFEPIHLKRVTASSLLRGAVGDSPVEVLVDEGAGKDVPWYVVVEPTLERNAAAIAQTEGLLVFEGHGWMNNGIWNIRNVQLSVGGPKIPACFVVFDACNVNPKDAMWAELFAPGTIMKFGSETVPSKNQTRVSRSRFVKKLQIWQVRAFLERVARAGVWKDTDRLDAIWQEVEEEIREEAKTSTKTTHVFQTYTVRPAAGVR